LILEQDGSDTQHDARNNIEKIEIKKIKKKIHASAASLPVWKSIGSAENRIGWRVVRPGTYCT
jgi:hypothetical protein